MGAVDDEELREPVQCAIFQADDANGARRTGQFNGLGPDSKVHPTKPQV
jgi:hypothetical protein